MLEVTSGCDGSTSRSYGLSLYGVGLGLNTTAIGSLQNFASGKYASVLTIRDRSPRSTGGCGPAVIGSPNGNFTYSLRQCLSQGAFAKGAATIAGPRWRCWRRTKTSQRRHAHSPFNAVSAIPTRPGRCVRAGEHYIDQHPHPAPAGRERAAVTGPPHRPTISGRRH
jgi:hypothetical protein